MAYPPPLQPNYYAPPPGSARPAGLAIASLVCGIVSLPLMCVPHLSLPLAVVAIVLGIVARRQARRGVAGGRGMATAGLACGAVTVGIAMLVVLALIGFVLLGSGHFQM